MSVTLKKPDFFYDKFFRRKNTQQSTHYCPGCGHGTVHKLIAEAIDDLGVGEKVVFCSPVGCSVFAYYYFDCCNVQCAHGRAPSVATAVRRTHDDAVVISYQGDGDLAGIGIGSIIHAANRGENITVFFVNNAIYGMTGGQMAPTTILGQRSATTPMGRSELNEGPPMKVAEIMDSLESPVFVERVSLGNAAKVMAARKAIRKALRNQVERKGFSFVEILSPCPINWKMSPVDAKRWLIENLEPEYPVKNFRDRSDEAASRPKISRKLPTDAELLDLFRVDKGDGWDIPKRVDSIVVQQIKIAGFGGQGVMAAGVLAANCAISEGRNSTWLPSYGPEMRGGTANASVIISDHSIGAPVVGNPNVLIAMNGPSIKTFTPVMQSGGLVFVNSSLTDEVVERDDLKVIRIPASDIAKDSGLLASANIVMLSAYAALTNVISVDTLRKVIPVSLKRKNLLEVNLRSLEAGVEYARINYAGMFE